MSFVSVCVCFSLLFVEYSESDSESSSSERRNQRGGFDGYYKMNKKAQTHKRMRKKRTAIPVQPPKVPFGTYVSPPEIPMLYQKVKTEPKLLGPVDKGMRAAWTNSFSWFGDWFCCFQSPVGKMYGDVQEEESSIDVSSPRDNNSPIVSI